MSDNKNIVRESIELIKNSENYYSLCIDMIFNTQHSMGHTINIRSEVIAESDDLVALISNQISKSHHVFCHCKKGFDKCKDTDIECCILDKKPVSGPYSPPGVFV